MQVYLWMLNRKNEHGIYNKQMFFSVMSAYILMPSPLCLIFMFFSVIWMILVAGGICGLLYYMIDRIAVYLRYDVNVNVIVNYVDVMEFPAVTICNQNVLK